jgi:hypothetical protein
MFWKKSLKYGKRNNKLMYFEHGMGAVVGFFSEVTIFHQIIGRSNFRIFFCIFHLILNMFGTFLPKLSLFQLISEEKWCAKHPENKSREEER